MRERDEMNVILLFDQYILAKQQNDIHFIWLHYRIHDKMKTLAWYDEAINSTMHTCILLEKFKL